MTDAISNFSAANTHTTEHPHTPALRRTGADRKTVSTRPFPRLIIIGAVLAAAALQLGFSAPAHAETLVSNTGRSTVGHTACVRGSNPVIKLDCAQGFFTGQNTRGYSLSSIRLDTHTAPGSGTLTVTVRNADGSRPGESVLSTLTNPSNMGTGLQTFTADDGTTLTRNTRYFVHINFSGSGTRPRWNLATDDREDSGKAIGWSIGDHRYTRQSGETGGWEGDGGVYSGSIQIRVQGDTLAPAAPTKLSATPGETRVVLTWDNPANNTITRYQYRRKTGTGAYGNWTDISGSGASTTAYTVTGLTSSTAYTFEVRAKNVGGNGEAATVTTATLPAAPTNLWPDPGDGAVTLSWTNPGGDTITIHEVSTDGGTTFSDIPNSAHGQTNATGYTVTGLTNGTEYTFKLRARNNSGEGAASTATATPRAPPDAPDGLSATAGDGQVTLSWTNWGDNTIWKYQVSTDGGSNYTDINGSSWTTTTYTVTGLSNGTQYTLALRAVNAYGNGDPANAPAIPLWPAPANLSVTPGEDRKATLTWDDPADSTIAKYQVSTDGGVNYTNIIGSSAATTTHEVTGLTNGTAYTLALRAANDLAGGTAAAITATPLWPAPTNLAADPGNGQAILQWDTGDASITDYRVHWQATNSGATPEISDVTAGSGLTTTTTISPLTNGTEYTFTVQAVDKSGSTAVITGLPSSATATPAPVPDGPANLLATARSQEVALTWDGSADSTITKYQVSTDSGTTFADIGGSSAATTATTVTDLTNGTVYTLAVRAVNDSGPGAAPRVTATPLWPAPTGLVAVPNNEQVTLQWDTGDSEIALYAVRTTLTGTQVSDNAHQSGSENKTTATVTGLTNGTEYTFTVRAASGTSTNFQITGVASTDTATPAAALPAKPTGLTPTARSQEVALTWTDPNNITITKYQVSTDAGAGTYYTDIPNSGQGQTNATGYTVTGLTNGIQYTFKLRAVNASGAGDASSVTATPIAVPIAPTNFKAKGLGTAEDEAEDEDKPDVGGGEVELTWDDPGNDTITKYQSRQRKGQQNSLGEIVFGNWADWRDISDSNADTTTHTVTGLSNGSEYTLAVRAINASGGGAASSDRAKPLWPAPSNLVATPDHGRVHLEWDRNPGIARYRVDPEETSTGASAGSFVVSAGSGSKVRTVVGVPGNYLENGTEHTFTVLAITQSLDISLPAEVNETPVVQDPPAAPTNLSATPGDRQVRLKWDNPKDFKITGYEVSTDYNTTDGSGTFTYISSSHENTTAHTVTRLSDDPATPLTNGTTYTLAVRAKNGTGPGAASSVTATPIAIPDAPTISSATPGDGQVALVWADPGDTSITKYQVRSKVRNSDDSTYTDWTDIAVTDPNAPPTGYTVTGLTNGTQYTFAVRAVNGTGNGLVATVNARPIAVPAAPTISSVTAGATEVALEWADPDDDTITGYQVNTDGGETFIDIEGSGAATTTHTVTGLTNGTEYTFQLRAVNASGVGAASTVTAPTLPAAPTGLMAEGGDGGGEVALTWDDPNNDTISGYQYSTDGGANYSAIPDSDDETTTHTVTVLSDGTGTGLTNGTAYTFQLRAVNASGAGAVSDDATATPLWPAPAELAAAPGDGQVTLTWDTGDPGIARYKVSTTYTSTGGTYLDTVLSPGSGDQTTLLIPGLTNRTDYTFTVQAVDTSGDDTVITGRAGSVDARPVPVPDRPANLAAIPANGQAVLTWDDPNDSSITKYQYRQRVSGADFGDWSDIGGSGADTIEHTVTGLTNGIAYGFELRAVNASGDGDASSVDATPIAVPNAPKNLMATPGDRRAALEWDTPSNGIIPITKYQYSTDDGTTFVDIAGSSAATTTYTVEFLSNPGAPLTNGTEYTFAVRAVNDLGPGLSAIDSATPITLPARPAISSVKPGNRQVALDWANPNDSTIARYQISTDDGTTYTTIEGSGAATTTHTVIVLSDGSGTRLSNGTEYTFAVRAVNAIGEGYASSANATPFDNPVTGSDKRVSTDEDTAHTFGAANFGFSDTDNGTPDHVKITWLPKPKEGTLSLRGTAITSATLPQLTLADLGGGQFTYMPPTDANGESFASFGFRVNDGGPATMTIDVTAVNDVPTASDGTVSTDEDTAYSFAAAEFGFDDVDAGDTLDHVKIATLPVDNNGNAQGTLSLDGTEITSITPPQQVTLAALDGGKLTYTPPADANGEAFASFGFKVNDGDADSALAYTITIDVTPVTEAPTASDKTVFTFEDTAYSFAAAEFGFSDADAGDTLDHVKITALPVDSNGNAQGTLSLDGTEITSITPPQQVTLAALDGGKLTYTPPADANGEAFASFGFKVNDGEVDSASAYTMTIDVTPMNDAPTASDKTVSTFEDTAYAFAAAEFGFSDADAGDTLDHVKITALPVDSNGNAQGTLSLDGTEITSVTPPQQVTLAALDGGKFTYTPPADANGEAFASFGFKVNDGEVDSASAYTMTIDVTPMNDAPTASDKTVSTDEDTAYAFAAAEFGFSDADDAGDTLDHVKITALPVDSNGNAQGTLSLDGTEITSVTPPQQVTLADLDGGKFTYTPPADANGEAFASFGFKVNDGEVDSASAYTMTIDVTPMNDAPTASDKTVSTFEDTAYAFAAAEFGFSDADAGDTLDHVKITALPVDSNGNAQGTLSLDGTEITSVTPPQQVTLAALDGGKLTYTPPIDANGEAFASFGFKVNDGEVDSALAYTMTIEVVPVLSVSFGAAAYEADEGGAAVEVNVTLDQEAIVALTIPIMVTPRGETVAADYQVDGLDAGTAQGVAGTLTFDVGQDTHTFTIKAKDDDDFDDETVTLSFGTLPAGAEEGDPATATLTIIDDEGNVIRSRFRRLNDEILSKHALTLADITIAAVTRRQEAGPRCAGQANTGSLGGQSSLAEILTANAQTLNTGRLNLKQLLGTSSFRLRLTEDGSGAGPGCLTLWGQGDYRNLSSGSARALEWDGDLLTGQVGADALLRPDLRAGLAVSWSDGAFDYTDRTTGMPISGDYSSRMVSVHPYVTWWSPMGLDLWATGGYGRGEIEIEDEEVGTHTSDTTLRLASVGASGLLPIGDALIAGGTTTLRVKAQASVAQMDVAGHGSLLQEQTIEAQRLRLALEGSHERPLASGGSLTPSLEVGLRHDGGDGATGTGLELGGGLRYVNPALGLTVEGRGRVLAAYEEDYEEWGASGLIRLDPGLDRQGLSFSLVPSYGQTASGVQRLWDQGLPQGPTQGPSATQALTGRLEAEVGYGLAAFAGQGLVTPYSAVILGGGTQQYRVGSRLELGPALRLSLEGTRQVTTVGQADQGIRLQVDWQF